MAKKKARVTESTEQNGRDGDGAEASRTSVEEGDDIVEDADEPRHPLSAVELQAHRQTVSRSRGPRFLSDILEDEESEGEDIVENAEQDYKAIDELDDYDRRLLADEESVDEISVDARREAESFMTKRDATERRARMPSALQADYSLDVEQLDGDSDSEFGRGEGEDQRAGRNRRLVDFEKLDPTQKRVDLDNFNVSLEEWLQKPEIVHEVERLFSEFLSSFKVSDDKAMGEGGFYEEEEEPFYIDKINTMCAQNLCSIDVYYSHLSTYYPTLALWLSDCPEMMLELFDRAATRVVYQAFRYYEDIHPEISVRIKQWPLTDNIRDLRTAHLGTLVKVIGVVTRRTSVLAQLRWVFYRCTRDCQTFGPFKLETMKGKRPPECGLCDDGRVLLDDEKSIYRNYQRILLQEPPGDVSAGRVPRYKEVVLTGDLVDTCRPGEKIELTGIFNLKSHRPTQSKRTRQLQFPVFTTYIEANSITQQDVELDTLEVSESQRQMFHKLAKIPHIFDTIVSSVSPSIFGLHSVKTALTLSLFGGQEKHPQGHRIRGDIHVLLVGDPGTAKSQCLKYLEKCVPRGVFTTGKGASAVGLTAAVQKDSITKEWVLEGGALVLADRGICMIDEFDKMSDKDRTSIHEAMEQQTISVSKAGIVATLRARCAVIAAANPVKGIYDLQKTFADNVLLTDPIIQRFDILCILKDNVNVEKDTRLAQFVIASHIAAHPHGSIAADSVKENQPVNSMQEGQNVSIYADLLKNRSAIGSLNDQLGNQFRPFFDENGLLKAEVLKKYILYAKTLTPTIQNVDKEKIARLYVELRRESVRHGGIPIAVRHMESIIRISEAYARVHLRATVQQRDVDFAISVMLNSFISAQKLRVQGKLRKSFGRYLFSKHEDTRLLEYLLREMIKDQEYQRAQRVLKGFAPDNAANEPIKLALSEFETKALELNVKSLTAFYRSKSFKDRFEVHYKDNCIIKKARRKAR